MKVKRGQGMSRDGEGKGLEIIGKVGGSLSPNPTKEVWVTWQPGGEGREVGVR